MTKTAYTIQATDGQLIAATLYEPNTAAIGHIHILHGMAEHSGRYEQFAQFLMHHGYAVSLHDQRGHGKTAALNHAPRGFFAEHDGFDKAVEDVTSVLMEIREGKDLPPVCLFGHSMGSFIARRYTELYSNSLSKTIFCGTGASNMLQPVGYLLAIILTKVKGKSVESPLLEKLSFGSYNRAIKDAKTDFDWLSTDEAEVQKYIDDPDCGFLSTNQFYADLAKGIIILSKNQEVSRIRKELPILLISGAKDPVGEFGKGVWKVAKQYQQCGLQHVMVQLLENSRHEILNEINREMVWITILKWLEKK